MEVEQGRRALDGENLQCERTSAKLKTIYSACLTGIAREYEVRMR